GDHQPPGQDAGAEVHPPRGRRARPGCAVPVRDGRPRRRPPRKIDAYGGTRMEQIRLGNTGLKVSRLCLGCMTYGSAEWRSWVLDLEQPKPFFQTAIEKGITFFDTANVYSIGVSEEVTGRWLREFARREEIVVATKVNGPMGPGE